MRVVWNVVAGVALVALSVGSGVAGSGPAGALGLPATTVLSNNVPHLGGLVATGVPSPSQRINVGVLLTSRDAAGLAAFTHDIETVGTAAYGHPLTPAAFNRSFGVEDTRGQAARDWLTGGGLRVPAGQPLEGRYVLATGTVASVSSLLGVRFSTYRAPDGSTFIANVNAPTVPTALGVVRVLGLNTSLRFHTLQTVPISMTTSPKDLWHLYDQPDLATNGGQGQHLATLLWGSQAELDPTVANDLKAFENGNGLPQVPLTYTWQHGYVDPGASSDTLGSGLLESDLDSQASTGMAPYATALTMYNAQDSLSVNLADAAGIWANDPNGAMQMSGSFGGCETLDFALEGAGLDSVFQQAVAEGRTVFVSTGDTGAGCGAVANVTNTPVIDVEYPASSPYVVAVGGTVVTETTHTSPTSEYAWNATGGGTSLYEAAPSWQQSVTDIVGRCVVDPNTVAWPLGPSTDPPAPTNIGVPCRGLPDVAAQSGDLISGYNIVTNGTATAATGTSLSAPLWQGMWARVQAAVPAARATTGNGFAAPLLYAQGANHPADFNDITVGDNGPYPATPGWDYVSGWGSPDLSKLMTDIDGGTVAGGGSAPPPPPPPPPPTPCASPVVTDPGGDATQLAGVVDAGNPSVSQADLDVLSGDLSWNSTTSVLTATIRVQNLSATPPNGLSTNEYFRFQFSADGGSWYLRAQRSPGAAGSADPSSQTDFGVVSNGVTGASATITGSFDDATNTVTITMPAAALASIGGTIKSGDALSALSILAQRSAGVFTLTADSASAAPAGCGYILPSAPAPALAKKGKGHKQ